MEKNRCGFFFPVLKFFNKDTKEIATLPLKDYSFNFKLSENKFCTGYFKDDQHFECRFNNITDSKTGSQCGFCENIQGFKSSFIYADLNHAMANEILSQEYYIYLGFFEPSIIKVGTAKAGRANKRLIEQDCLLYTFIAKGTGFKVQKLEHLISKQFGITETVKSNHKFKYLSIKPNTKLALEKFESYFSKIKNEFINNTEYSDLFFEKIDVKNLSTTNELFFPDKYKKFDDLNLFGTFKGLRGRYLFIENDEQIAGLGYSNFSWSQY